MSVAARTGSISVPRRTVLATLVTLLLGATALLLLDVLLFTPHRELRVELERAETRLRTERRLLAQADAIHARFLEIDGQRADTQVASMTESAVLGRVAGLAGPRVRVESLAPRRTNEARTLELSLDFEGPFPDVVAYLETLLERGPSRIERLSLAADPRRQGHVTGRVSIEVIGLER